MQLHNHKSDIEIRLLGSVRDQSYAIRVFNQTWKSKNSTEITPNLMQAMVHSGAYLSGAFIDGVCVGASFAFPATNGGVHLHSHMTAVLSEFRNKGIGFRLKIDQWHWAKKNGYTAITWTFDPLISRNARLNITKLGSEVVGYFPNFYGHMTDDLNAGDETDRLMVSWKLTENSPNINKLQSKPQKNEILIKIPDDILLIRKQNKQKSMKWRLHVRKQFLSLLKQDGQIIGFSPKNEYIVRI